MFDIASAFDKVWHQGLVYKLIKYKTPLYLIRIIEEFLKNRTFSVKVGSFTTARHVIKCGVPQGAVLSPTLFSIFINDLPLKFEKNKKYSLLFADDLVFLALYKRSRQNLENSTNTYLGELEKWSDKWRLTFAPSKCSYTVFTKGKKNAEEQNFSFKMYGESISKVNDPKFLGIRFDPYLSGKNQVDYIRSANIDRLNIIKIISHKSWQLDASTVTKLYQSLIRSLIEYAGFQFNLLSKANKNRLEALENNALRIIYRKKREFGNDNLHKLAGLEPLETRLNRLNDKFLEKAESLANPLISSLIDEYIEQREQFNDFGAETPLGASEYIEEVIKNMGT